MSPLEFTIYLQQIIEGIEKMFADEIRTMATVATKMDNKHLFMVVLIESPEPGVTNVEVITTNKVIQFLREKPDSDLPPAIVQTIIDAIRRHNPDFPIFSENK